MLLIAIDRAWRYQIVPCLVGSARDQSLQDPQGGLKISRPERATVMSEFYAYDNHHRDRARVHRGECPWCNHGQSVQGGSSGDNDRWHGPFGSAEDAYARVRHRADVGYCAFADRQVSRSNRTAGVDTQNWRDLPARPAFPQMIARLGTVIWSAASVGRPASCVLLLPEARELGGEGSRPPAAGSGPVAVLDVAAVLWRLVLRAGEVLAGDAS